LIGQKAVYGGHASELYFETTDIAGFLHKIQGAEYKTRWLNPPAEYAQRNETEDMANRQVVRFYDPDGNLIEVGTPM